MKKRLIVLLTTIFLTLSFASCGKSEDNIASDLNSLFPIPQINETATPEVPGFNYGSSYIDEHLKGDYSITYKITSSGTGETTSAYDIKMMHTDAGYYISMGEGRELLYIKAGDKYTMYMGDSKNGFVAYGEPTYSEDDVKSQTQLFLGYMTMYVDFKEQLKMSGTETIAGKSCDKYLFDYDFLGSKLKYEYYIDKETGVCMKFYIEGSGAESAGQFTFECTEFKTDGVTLPAYK